MKRVLITGVTGFAGSHLAEYLLEMGADVTGVDISEDMVKRAKFGQVSLRGLSRPRFIGRRPDSVERREHDEAI